jgi:HK97 gp10 family phage protein
MANGLRLRLEGMDLLQRRLELAPNVVKHHVSIAVGISSVRLAQRARELAPEDTGLLKREIRSDHEDGSLEAGVGVSKLAWYWGFLEFGTVNMSARPFFRPAAEEGQADLIRQIAEAGPDIEHQLTK